MMVAQVNAEIWNLMQDIANMNAELRKLEAENRWLKQQIFASLEALELNEIIIEPNAVTYIGMPSLVNEIKKLKQAAD